MDNVIEIAGINQNENWKNVDVHVWRHLTQKVGVKCLIIYAYLFLY